MRSFTIANRSSSNATVRSRFAGPIGRALTNEEQKRLLETAASNPEWEHVYCAAVLANTSMRGVEVTHVGARTLTWKRCGTSRGHR
jgi:hypothetical protein